jgi:glucose/arabinose dehydrogenase
VTVATAAAPTIAPITVPPPPTEPPVTTVDPAAAPTVAPQTVPETVPPTTVPPPPPPDPLPPIAQLEQVGLAIQPVTTLDTPIAIAWRPGDPAPYIAGQKGQVWRVDPATGASELVFDLTGRVTDFADGSERGLLGLTFGPDGRMFLNFTDQLNDTNIISMAMNGNAPDPASEWAVLFIDQPNNGLGHKAGTIDFDASGHLFVAMGDGGGSNGRDAQDPQKLLGTILRIIPKADGPGYDIPPDNPFVGHPEILPEKWVYGFRNPWRFSIDDETGDIWLGDVGNTEIEEVDVIPAGTSGTNYGWYYFEGTRQRHSDGPPDMVPPVWEYTHEVGVSVIAGAVYRGSAIPGLRGSFVFGDLTGIFWAFGADGVQRLPIKFRGLAGFGEEPGTGELWIVSIWGDVSRIVAG